MRCSADPDDGPLNMNFNNDPMNRNDDIGSVAANSSMLSGRFMFMSYNLLFQKAYDLVKWIYPTVNKFPRKQRIVLSQRIELTSIRILELIIDLNNSDTVTKRRKIKDEIQKLQVLLRLSKDLSYLSFRKYEYVSVLLDNIWGGAYNINSIFTFF
ncbi:MAG: four helix bundle protein [Candidatus Aenigmarchaeota archaeon]|nr:four helix bundle protein [Candidatus Aenigmarchaeota archaeon]